MEPCRYLEQYQQDGKLGVKCTCTKISPSPLRVTCELVCSICKHHTEKQQEGVPPVQVKSEVATQAPRTLCVNCKFSEETTDGKRLYCINKLSRRNREFANKCHRMGMSEPYGTVTFSTRVHAGLCDQFTPEE